MEDVVEEVEGGMAVEEVAEGFRVTVRIWVVDCKASESLTRVGNVVVLDEGGGML